MKPLKSRIFQFVEFALVGILNALISWCVYALCIRLGGHYIPATFLGFSVSMVNATFWNRKFVFKNEKQSWWKSFIRTYIAYSVTALFLNSLLLHLWIDVLEIWKYFTPVCNWFWERGIRLEGSRRLAEYSMPLFNYCITVPINYVLNKFWAFGGAKKEEDSLFDGENLEWRNSRWRDKL